MERRDKSIILYEEVRAKDPITGAIQVIQIEKPDVLTPEEHQERIKAELTKMGLEPEYTVEVTDPLTEEKRIVTLDRMGTTDEKLVTALSDPKLSRDRKDFMVSMYLYERGAHNTSMLVDLFRYKGEHTKETRVFKSQVRYDFEMFVNHFTQYLDNQSRLLGVTLGVDIAEETKKFKEWLELPNNKGKGKTYTDFNPIESHEKVALIEMSIYAKEEADILKENVRRMADARERDKGKGIYIDTLGRPYTLDDPQLEDIIRADREATAQIIKEDGI